MEVRRGGRDLVVPRLWLCLCLWLRACGPVSVVHEWSACLYMWCLPRLHACLPACRCVYECLLSIVSVLQVLSSDSEDDEPETLPAAEPVKSEYVATISFIPPTIPVPPTLFDSDEGEGSVHVPVLRGRDAPAHCVAITACLAARLQCRRWRCEWRCRQTETTSFDVST